MKNCTPFLIKLNPKWILMPIFLATALVSCVQNGKTSRLQTPSIDTQHTVSTIAFGSCNKQDHPQHMWDYVLMNKPDLWIWLGDIIYGDSDNPSILDEKYSQIKSNLNYQALLKSVPVIGVWDDHDYGINDGDKNFSIKSESKKSLLKFLDISDDSEIRQHEGVYSSYIFGSENQQVKVILLDGRYFRDTLANNPVTGGQRSLFNVAGDILGEKQWAWLENELDESEAEVNIIGCGIQMIAEDHFFEKWANFPNARKRLLSLLDSTKAKNLILLSGDRHLAEISRVDLTHLSNPLYEITSSGMTHSYEEINSTGEPNRHRVDDKLTADKNFGILKIDWSANPLKVEIQIRGLGNELLLEHQIILSN